MKARHFRVNESDWATGVILVELILDTGAQYTLLDDPVRAEQIKTLYAAIDEISRKYGKHTLFLGGSHAIEVNGAGKRGAPTVYGAPLRSALPAAASEKAIDNAVPGALSIAFSSVIPSRKREDEQLRAVIHQARQLPGSTRRPHS
jgi:hypothetical protein